MKIKLADGLPFHPTMVHPHTGERLQAVGVLRGKPIWPVIGASEDDDAGDKGDSEDETEEEGEADKEEENGSEKPKSSKKAETTPDRIAELEADIARMRKHLSNSDKKKTAAERELQALRDKDLPEIEKLRKDLEAEKADRAKSSSVLSKLAVTNAFLKASQRAKINWHDPDVAAALIKNDDVEIDDDGNVTGMLEAVRKLAKDKGFLVDVGKGVDEEEEAKDKKNGPSGSALGSGTRKKGGNQGMSADELRKTFPALNR